MRYIVPTLLAAAALSACSNNDNFDLKPLQEKTFTGDNLKLYYNGEIMPNKSVTINQSGNTATAKFFGEFDLSQLSAFGLSGTIPAPGVFPGDPVTTLPLEMNEAGEYWNFLGSGETTACTFSYKGYANDENMAIFFSDVKLKTPAITPAVWKPAPIKNENGAFTSLPFFIRWDYDPIPDVDIDLSPYLEALTTLPIIPAYNNTAYMSISQAVSLMLQTVGFTDDGNMVVSYLSSVGGASHLAQTLPNRFMYLPISTDRIKLYLNPTALFGLMLIADSSGTPAEDVKIIGNGIYPSGHVTEVAPGVMESIIKSEIGKKLAKAALSVLLPKLADGLTFDISEADGQLHFCFDNQVAMQMIEEMLTPILADDEAVKAIQQYIESNANLKPLLPLLDKALQLLPQAIERTNNLQVGLALVPYTAQ